MKTYRFAIASKKNIYLFEFDLSVKSYVLLRDFSVGEQMYSITFFGDEYLCYAGMKCGYMMHNIATGKNQQMTVPIAPDIKFPLIYASYHSQKSKTRVSVSANEEKS